MFHDIIQFIKKIFRFDSSNLFSSKDDLELKMQEVPSLPFHPLYESIQVYDILYVHMRDCDIVTDINPSHTTRPFLVVKKDPDHQSIQGYYATSNINDPYMNQISNHKYRFVLDQNKYRLPGKKNSLVRTDRMIDLPIDCVIRPISHLDEDDQEKLHKLTSLLHHQPVVVQHLELGDIFTQALSNHYLVYQQDNSNSYGFKVNRVSKVSSKNTLNPDQLKQFQTGDSIYEASFSELNQISNHQNFYIVSDLVTDSELNKVLENRKKIKYLAKQSKRKK